MDCDLVSGGLRAAIAGNNLPIDVVALSLGANPGKLPFPWWHSQDLFHLHHLARADMAAQLDDATKFGDKFVLQVKAAAGTVTDADNDGVPVLGTAQTKTELMAGHAKLAMQKIVAENYNADSNWQSDLANAAQSAAELSEALSPVTKKEFVTPLDAIMSGQPARWLTWVDALIKDRQDQEQRRSQLPGFLAEHPGLEHYAGVLRGGTFVLVYDAANTVVADFMLPYNCCEPKTSPPKPPVLLPPIRPDILFEKPIRLVPFPDKFRFDKFRDDFVQGVQKDIDVKTNYFNAFKDTIGIIAGAKGGGGLAQPGGVFVQPGIVTSDPVLGLNVTDMTWKTQKVDTLREQLLDPSLDETKRATIQTQLDTAENELASTIVTTTEYVAKAGIDVTPGSDGAKAMGAASGALAKVGNIDALTNIEKGLTNLGNSAGTTPQMNTVIGNLLSGRGIR